MTARMAAVAAAPVNGAVALVFLALLVAVVYALKGSSRARNAAARPTIRETRTQVLHPERLCMMKNCGNEFKHSTHGWKTCDEHTFGMAS